MEKTAELKEKQSGMADGKESEFEVAKPLIWDCGSSLYDSFELKSFERQLDSAIHSRTLSMPHLSDRRVHLPPSQPHHQQPMSKKSSKISRSFYKLIRSVFKPKQNQNSPLFQVPEEQSKDEFFVVYDRPASLTTVPEAPELDRLSPEIRSQMRRTTSDRFTFTSIGISCA